jgi:hypothetical protein
MHKLNCFPLSAAAVAFAALVAVEARSAELEGAHSNTRLPPSERMPNRHRRPEWCRSSYRRGASN